MKTCMIRQRNIYTGNCDQRWGFSTDISRQQWKIVDDLSLTDVVLENQDLLREIEIWKSQTIDKIIGQTSSLILSAIKSNITPSPWPYHPSDVSRCDPIPKELERFLVGLLTGNPDKKSQTNKVSTLVQSFSQDMMVCCDRWQTKTNGGCSGS